MKTALSTALQIFVYSSIVVATFHCGLSVPQLYNVKQDF